MTRRLVGSERGFTYLAAMVAVIIMGITLGVSSTFWATRMKREREVELLWRGMQYRDAIRAWRGWDPKTGKPDAARLARRGVQQPVPLTDLKNLLQAPSSAGKDRLLRKLYKDPITGGDFVAITDPNEGIIGVKSKSEQKPLKVANFPDDQENGLEPNDFENKEKYSDWQFIYNRVPKPGAKGGVSGLPTSGTPGTSQSGEQPAPSGGTQNQ